MPLLNMQHGLDCRTNTAMRCCLRYYSLLYLHPCNSLGVLLPAMCCILMYLTALPCSECTLTSIYSILLRVHAFLSVHYLCMLTSMSFITWATSLERMAGSCYACGSTVVNALSPLQFTATITPSNEQHSACCR